MSSKVGLWLIRAHLSLKVLASMWNVSHSMSREDFFDGITNVITKNKRMCSVKRNILLEEVLYFVERGVSLRHRNSMEILLSSFHGNFLKNVMNQKVSTGNFLDRSQHNTPENPQLNNALFFFNNF